MSWRRSKYVVSLASQFIRYTVNCTSRDSVSHLLTHLVVYIIARCSSLNTTTFCLFPVCPVLPHPTCIISWSRRCFSTIFLARALRFLVLVGTAGGCSDGAVSSCVSYLGELSWAQWAQSSLARAS